MDTCPASDDMPETLKNLQTQNVYLLQTIRSLYFFIMLSVLYSIGSYFGWISSIRKLLSTLRNYTRAEESKDNIQVIRADNAQSGKQKENAKSSAFNFETRTISHTRKKSDEILRIHETWVNKKVRECITLQEKLKRRNELAKAVQANCEDIIDYIPWTQSSLPDQLIQTKAILETECRHISKMTSGEQNKLRTLLIIMLNRDYRSLLSFVTCMENFFPQIKEKILKSITTEEGHTEKCPRCLLKDRVNITHVVDRLFGKGYISRSLYSKVGQIDIFTGSQDELWDTLLAELLDGNNTEGKIELLADTVLHLGFHSDIAELLFGVLSLGRSGLQCKCGPQMMLLKDSEESGERDSGLFAECQREESGSENEDQGNSTDGKKSSVKDEHVCKTMGSTDQES